MPAGLSSIDVYKRQDETKPNEAGLAYYDRLIDEIIKNGMQPIITIFHYDMPIYLVNQYGGWQNPKLVDFYVNYAKVLIKRYHHKVKYWICINQINLLFFEMFPSLGVFKENCDNYQQVCYQSIHHQFIACAKVKQFAKSLHDPDLMIGTCLLFTSALYAMAVIICGWCDDLCICRGIDSRGTFRRTFQSGDDGSYGWVSDYDDSRWRIRIKNGNKVTINNYLNLSKAQAAVLLIVILL